ncbi:MAG: hypothetical protein FWG18_02520 [Alphaproteobacteria bacterium]|nr:hypothetical protein [Alphaproteobacteria bacterium]
MKKTKKMVAVVAAAVIGTPAIASTTNMENPLYMPKSAEVYGRLGVGLMYKKANDNTAMQNKGQAGDIEFPIWRGNAEVGVGLADWLTLRGAVGYTQDDSINRKGMHHGRIGLNFRVFDETQVHGWVWDVYGDMHLGGLSKMTGTFNLNMPTPPKNASYFDYDNYTNGRWGLVGGTQIGRTFFDRLTLAAFAEILYTFGNSNNDIALRTITTFYTPAPIPAMDLGNISVYLKSTTEYNAGLRGLYEIDDLWSVGGGFTYKYRAANGVEALARQSGTPTQLAIQNALVPALLAGMADMKDGIQEYILTAVVARQMTDWMQLAVYGEYTFDDAQPNSQNGTEVKWELGVRLNVRY